MAVYYSIPDYLQTACGTQDKIAKLDAIIDALLTIVLKAVESGHIDEYMLNDGQTTIRTKYRDVETVTKSVRGLENLRQFYENRLPGRSRVTRLTDSKNFPCS